MWLRRTERASEREQELRERAQAVVDEHMKIYGAMGAFSKMGQLAETLSEQEETRHD